MGGYGADLDFFRFKGDVETIFDAFRIKNVKFTAQHDNPSYHPGRCAVISIDGVEVGVMGQLHPLVNENYNVEQPMFAAEIHLDTLLAARPQGMHYKALPKFPAVERDIAVVCDRSVPVADLEDCIRKASCGLIKAVETFDPQKNSRLAAYAARCIDNELLMMLRSKKKTSREVSLYEPIGTDREGNEINLLDVMEQKQPDIVEEMEKQRLNQKLYELMENVLSLREKEVLYLRYGLPGGTELTQKEVGKRLGISRSYVSRIEKRALLRLRDAAWG